MDKGREDCLEVLPRVNRQKRVPLIGVKENASLTIDKEGGILQ
jgi:hypothetical protein